MSPWRCGSRTAGYSPICDRLLPRSPRSTCALVSFIFLCQRVFMGIGYPSALYAVRRFPGCDLAASNVHNSSADSIQPGFTACPAGGGLCLPLKIRRRKKMNKTRAHGPLGTRGKSLSHMGECPASLEAQCHGLGHFLPGFSGGDIVLHPQGRQ